MYSAHTTTTMSDIFPPTKIQKFLTMIGLSLLFKTFENEEIDYDLLGSMTVADYKELGVSEQDYCKIINNLNLIVS
jgi:hypothetical protein